MIQLINGPKGLKILICSKPESLSTSLLILVGVGADWENKKNNGIFHFIEHLYFKGTKNYPSPKILMEAIDDLGGSFNAFTGYEYTGYYIKVLPEYSLNALEILSDIILNPLLPEEEIEKERKVIFEEINLHKDLPQELVLETGQRLAFGDQPAGWSILGTKETISKITKQDILENIKNHYSTKNTIIVLSGKIQNQKKLLDYIFKRFSQYNSVKPRQKSKFIKPTLKYQQKIITKDVEQAHLFLGFPLPGFIELRQKRIPLHLLSIILGEKASSRLWLKIREELGSAYYIRSHFSEYTDRSLFFIHAGLSLNNLDLTIRELAEEIHRLKIEGPNIKEFQTSKAILKSALLMDLEESLAIAFFYGRQYLLEKKLKTPKELTQEINQIKIEDLKNLLSRLFTFSQAKLAVVIPEKTKINFDKILKEVLK